MDRVPASVRIERSGYTLVFVGGEREFVAAGDTEHWHRLRDSLAGQGEVSLLVPKWAALPVPLPALPKSDRAMRAMLRRLAPVMPEELAWTEPRACHGGGAETRIVRRAWLNPISAEIARELGRATRVIVEPSGEALLYPERQSGRGRLGVVWLAVLALLAAAAGLFIYKQWMAEPARSADGQIASAAAELPTSAPPPAVLAPAAPAPASAGASPSLAQTDGPPEVIGIVGRLPDDAEVLVRNRDGTTATLRIGEDAQGWRLVAVAADRASFEGFGMREVMTLPAP